MWQSLAAQQGKTTMQVKENTLHPAPVHSEHSREEHVMQSFGILLWDLYRDRMTVVVHFCFKTETPKEASLGYSCVLFGQIPVIAQKTSPVFQI